MSKRAGRHSSQANDFLEPLGVTSLSATDVGTARPYLATANTTSAASAAGTGAAASLTWTLPANSPEATSYTITTTPTTYTVTTGSSTPSYTFQGLASNTAYTFTVTGTNNAGASKSPTTSSSVTFTTVPAAPATPSYVNNGQNTNLATWSAPVTGGKAITEYTMLQQDGDAPTFAAGTTSANISESDYESAWVKVKASNANGYGEYSAQSSSVTTTPFSFAPFSFTPFNFTPFNFTPFNFTPFNFTPFNFFGFVPFAPFNFFGFIPFSPFLFVPFSFAPFAFFSFAPFSFAPFGFFGFFSFFSFAPAKCIHEDTLIMTPSGMVPAKDIQINDKVYSIEIEEVPVSNPEGDGQFDYDGFTSTTLQSTSGLVETTIINSRLSVKNHTIYFNGEDTKKFSLEQPMFIKRNNEYEIVPSGVVEEGDYLLKIDSSGNIIETLVEEMTVIEGPQNVYLFDCEPQDWFIAGDYLVHNK